ncbi:helix-turn-helix domain-containing protein [Telmatobacter bradus]|uniref:AraC family transcriptional regulator n=1 Tax=Telmatobacter bradus TaxID=474953 RepID=UPI003B439063
MFWSAQFTVARSTEWEVHEVFEFMFCHSGAGQVLVEEHKIDLHPSCMVLIVPGARHRVVFEADQSADLKIVCVTAQDTSRYLSPVQVDLLESLRSHGCTSSDSATELPILAELVRLIPEGSVIGNHRQLLTVWNVIGLLLATQANDQSPAVDEARQKHRNRIQDVCLWLDHHLEEESNLDEIGSRFGLSRSLLTRAFRQHTGTSIVHYVNARRLEKAAVLLTSSKDRTITQAAFESGFSNLSNFHRRFKTAYGFTPAEFRRNFAN